uniref:Uncharacterized protein n=1 Tax=Romanomermis culicivorax TaxID=13658 RepID=A0A915KCR8_ROMCU
MKQTAFHVLATGGLSCGWFTYLQYTLFCHTKFWPILRSTHITLYICFWHLTSIDSSMIY